MRDLHVKVTDNKEREWILTGTSYRNRYGDHEVDVESCEVIVRTLKRSKRLSMTKRQAEMYIADLETTLLTGEAY